MEHLGNKLIEINVTDSSLLANVPNTGSSTGLFSTVTDSLASTPATVIMLLCLFIGLLACLAAIILSRAHHNKEKGSKLSKLSKVLSKVIICITPVLTSLAVLAAPILNTIALIESPNSINSTPISITIDKAKTLSASKEVALTITQDASSYVDIYAKLDTTFNNNLGTNILVSTNHTNDSESTVNLSTTEQLIYTTPGPIEAGIVEDFNVSVNITKNLPIGTYKGQIDYYGDYVQEEDDRVTITYWCYGGPDSTEISQTVTYELNETFYFPAPHELGLECNSGYDEGHLLDDYYWQNAEKINDSRTFYYWPYWIVSGFPMEGAPGITLKVPSQFTGPQPDPSNKSWYESCWLDFDSSCDLIDDYMDWLYDVYFPWEDQYVQDWYDWAYNFKQEHPAEPLFNGMDLWWTKAY